ncbi:hypothetical protein B296_00023564 [Ensete ventricosum]|uniref:Uncharacterized protein n=1 Tax=Ensete ventricosum TaxID=4639 RepID=A0A426XQ86_ENSVE|nr:hypothetical protein B296_00023564 [Ensete ventricosum]
MGVIITWDRPPWNSIEVPSSKLLLKGYRKYSSINDERRENTRLFIGLLNPNS